jgi:eukaryotic-like serine/threonine-protein kinase
MNSPTGSGSRPNAFWKQIEQDEVKSIGHDTNTRENAVESGRRLAGSLCSLATSTAGLVPDDPRVIAALEAYLDAMRAGHPWSREQFLDRHTEIAEALGQCLSGLEFVQTAAATLGGPQSGAAGYPADAIPACAQLGDYRILREVGRGGMGVVYEAEQVSLGRRVALKVLPFAAAIDPKQRQRFQIEAQAAALLHHPHIVPIFGVGCDHGIHYYAMQFVEGRSLAAILHLLQDTNDVSNLSPAATVSFVRAEDADARAPVVEALDPNLAPLVSGGSKNVVNSSVPSAADERRLAAVELGPKHQARAFCRDVARIGADAADALDHAHGLGILHRDIKPANLLIDPQGTIWITDFGLARFPSDLSLTPTGDMVGTLRYMSPEQALARRGVVDQRTDIYALGATLYELLTLRPPFDGRDHQELLRQIALDEPVPPRRFNPAVPSDLETILLKAMAKEPSSRYTTAQELAADFRRFLADQPILARRPKMPERALRWARRHGELVATAAAILLLALTVGTAASWAQARKTAALARETEAARKALQAHIIETFPLLDRLAVNAMEQANKLVTATADAQARENANQISQEALLLYKRASEIPPADSESRKIIARAFKQLGFSRAILSGATRNGKSPAPAMLEQAVADYRRSIDLYEALITEAPDDRGVRRAFAEALGESGWGWLLWFTRRSIEAEPHYRRSVGLWRELVADFGERTTLALTPEEMGREPNDLVSFAGNVHVLCAILETKGQAAAAEDLRRQLTDDVTLLAQRLAGPAFREQRRKWAWRLVSMGQTFLYDDNTRVSESSFRLAMILDPDNAEAHNNLAWLLVRTPSHSMFDPALGLTLAQRAVALDPNDWRFLNTLGVAAFRAGEWDLAAETLRKSTTFTGGSAHDWFFLAMTRWHQGKKREAKEWFGRAVEFANKNSSPIFMQREVHLFHTEAASLLGLPGPKTSPNATLQKADAKVPQPAEQTTALSSTRGRSAATGDDSSKAKRDGAKRIRRSSASVAS